MEAFVRRHFSSNIIVQKILDASYWWWTMNWNIHEYYRTCDQCQKTCNLLTQNLAKLVTTLPKEPFQKWGLDFIGHVKTYKQIVKQLIHSVATNYATKWVEAWALHTNIVVVTTKFQYKHIFMKFGCPLTIAIDQGTHFINDAIKYLTNHFILKHTSSTIYYPQGNG